MDSSQMHFCRDIWLMAAQEGVKETAREAKRREKSGLPRGVSREMEQLIRQISPRLSIPAEEESIHIESSKPESSKKMVQGTEKNSNHQGNVDLSDNDAHLPQADFDKTDGVGAGRDLSAEEVKEEEKKKAEQANNQQSTTTEEKSVGGKPLPKGQEKKKRDEIIEDSEKKIKKKEDDDKKSSSEGGDSNTDSQTKNGVIGDVPNSEFNPARILVNPRCITTYAGVSHTQLALDLFGSGDDIEPSRESGGKYHFDEWLGAPHAFVCQEMRTTGGQFFIFSLL